MTPTEELLLKADKQWKRFLAELELAQSIGLVPQRSIVEKDVVGIWRNAGPFAPIGCLCRFYFSRPEKPRGEVPLSINVRLDGLVRWDIESMFFNEPNQAALAVLLENLKRIGRDGSREVE